MRHHKTKTSAPISEGDFYKPAGKLYAYSGNLSRFFFIERNKDLAFTGGNSGHFCNPYKYKSGSGDHLVPNNDNGFCEYGVDPQDLVIPKEGETVSIYKALTEDWVTAFQSAKTTSLKDALNQVMTAYNGYGCFAMTHDCSGGTWRSHFMHSNVPVVTNPFGTSATNPTNQQRADISVTLTTTDMNLLLFVPAKPNSQSAWVNTDVNDYYIYPDRAPYIQYYLANFNLEGGTETGKCRHQAPTDPQLDEQSWHTHIVQWYTNVFDKLCDDYYVATRTQQQQNDRTGTETEKPDDQKSFNSPKETFKVQWRYEGEETWNDAGTNFTFYGGDEHHYKGSINWPRYEDPYNVEYRVVCTIDDLGVTTFTSEILTLPVPGTGTTASIDLTPRSSSQAVDNVNRGEGDTSYGYNHITHTLDVTKGTTANHTGVYTITRQYKNSNDGEWQYQYMDITVTRSGDSFVYTPVMRDGTVCPEGTVTQTLNNHFEVIWPTRHDIDYMYSGEGWDNYSIEFTATGSEQTVSAGPKQAPVYRTTYNTFVMGTTEIAGSNPLQYKLEDNSSFKANDAYTYFVRFGGVKSTVYTDQWEGGNIVDKKDDQQASVEVPTTKDVKASDIPDTGYVINFCGYITYRDYRGTWGVGNTQAVHKKDDIPASELNVVVKPHNQVIEVAMNPEQGSVKTNPIWNYPCGKDETMQIFPGVDFIISSSGKIPEGYRVAFGLVIYDKNGTRLVTHGEEYFSKITAGDTNLGKTDKRGVHTPDFEGFITPQGDNAVTTTQNVMWDFTDENGPYHYDAFVFYINSSSGHVVSYAHSGAKAMSNKVKADNYYGSANYAKNDLPIVDINQKQCEKVEFVNENTGTPGTKYIQLGDGAVKASIMYEGNTANRYDGFAYVVLDLDKAIPTKDVNFQERHVTSNSDNLRPAITSYKIYAFQNGNMDAVTPQEGSSDVQNGLKVFYPTNGDKQKYDKEGKPIGTPTYFNIDDFDDGGSKPFVGTAPGLHWDTDPTTELYVYGDVTREEATGFDLVEGYFPTNGQKTQEQMRSNGNNCVLIGLRFIDKEKDAGHVVVEGNSASAPRKGEPKYEHYLKNPITLYFEPEYTVAKPEKPVFSFAADYPEETGYTPTYATDPTPETTATPENSEDTPSLIDDTDPVKNKVWVLNNPNRTTAYWFNYLAQKIFDNWLGRENPQDFILESLVSAVDDVKGDSENVKVFADGRDIVVEGAEGEVIVFNAYGQSVYAGHSSRIAMAQPGVYLVAANGSIYKVFVK